MGIRIFEPCDDPSGANCTLFEDPATLHLPETRWYPSAIKIFDGSLVPYYFLISYSLAHFSLWQMIAGGMHEATGFYNTDPVNTYEFFPSKDGNVPRPSAFLKRSLPANLFPRKVKSRTCKFILY